jgi:adenine-specific DNA-methyltransferase
VIKYLGSKRTLVPVLGEIASAVEAKTAVDLFTGTTRVAQEFKRRGVHTTATDLATYSFVLAQCYVGTDADRVDQRTLAEEIARLNSLPGRAGYVTETFCERSRFFQPRNGARIDAIRAAIEADHADSPLRPLLLASLLLAADRVDSTTGLQMAYLKEWAPRSHRELTLQVPDLLPGPGAAVHGDALETVAHLPPVDLMYLDPPYNQHRYFTNYHIWETLVRWDEPDHYGVACKRIDSRDDATRSPFNSRRSMRDALAQVVAAARAEVLVLSYNDESWVTADEITGLLRDAGHDHVGVLEFDRKRYVGAQIGIFNRSGDKVGQVARLRNTEYVFVAGPRGRVAAALSRAQAAAN